MLVVISTGKKAIETSSSFTAQSEVTAKQMFKNKNIYFVLNNLYLYLVHLQGKN